MRKQNNKKTLSFLIFILLFTLMCPICFAENIPILELSNMQEYDSINNRFCSSFHISSVTPYQLSGDLLSKEEEQKLIEMFSDDALLFHSQMVTTRTIPDDLITYDAVCKIQSDVHKQWHMFIGKDGVFIRCLQTSPRTFYHGYFTYRNPSSYDEILDILKPYAEERANEEQEYQEENTQNIYHFKPVYNASFKTDVSLIPTIYWGIASYSETPESTDTKYIAYCDLAGDGAYVNNLTAQKTNAKNVIEWDLTPELLILPDEIFFDKTSTSMVDVRFQLELSENRQVKNVLLTLQDLGTQTAYNGQTITKLVDMYTYIFTGEIPECENLDLSAKNNADVFSQPENASKKEQEQKTSETKKSEDSRQPDSEIKEETQKETELKQQEKAEDSMQTEENIALPEQTEPELKNPNPDTIAVFVNGVQLEFVQEPIIQNDRCMVPMRKIFESLGATVEWEQTEKRVFATKGGKQIGMQIGSFVLNKENDKTVLLDAMPMLVNNYTLVPIRAVAEALDANVEWNATERIVTIETK